MGIASLTRIEQLSLTGDTGAAVTYSHHLNSVFAATCEIVKCTVKVRALAADVSINGLGHH